MIKKEIPEVQIELTNICNSNCATCPIPSMKRERKFMDFSLFKKIIDDLSNMNYTGNISPFLNGESLLVPNVLDYFRYIRSKVPKATITLYSNGSKLDNFTDSILNEDLLDDLVISFDGGTKEVYENVRKGMSFDKVSSNVHKFISRRNKLGKKRLRVIISMVVTKLNYHTRMDLKKEFNDADEVNFHKCFNYAGQHGGDSEYPKNKIISFLTKQNFCQRLNLAITILVDGRVALCCFDYEGKEIIGDIKNNSIMDVWNGEKLNRKIDDLKHRRFENLPLCSRCDFINHNIFSRQIIKIESLISKSQRSYNFLKNLWIKFSLK